MIDSCEMTFSANGCSDDLAEQNHTYRMSESEYFHYRQNWWISLNKSGNDTQPLRKRSVFKQALSTLKRLHQEAGGDQREPIPCWKYRSTVTECEDNTSKDPFSR